MITNEEVIEIGRLQQPHGIKGEINALIYDGVDVDRLSCVVLDIDGINVPFFISGIRQRGVQSYLVAIDGIENEQKAASISNKTLFALKKDVGDFGEAYDEDGFYAEDLIGYKVETVDGGFNGTITDVDDTTENVLFIVTGEDGAEYMIPVADEFIAEIDTDTRKIIFDLPEGLI